MKPVTREEIQELYEAGYSKQEAKHMLKKEHALEEISDIKNGAWFDKEERFRKLLSIVEYLVDDK